jgi:hypothetical protein
MLASAKAMQGKEQTGNQQNALLKLVVKLDAMQGKTADPVR